ncbi:MAG: 2Fe-2S iron-sulfur cluster-binding protein [Halioglobus sp.]
MPTITFIDHAGNEREIDATNGDTIMENAMNNEVPGIDADCGGGCACATCHVYVDASFMDKVGEPDDMETQMLQFAADVHPNSRLSCQITMSDELEGLRVTTPESQH